MRAAGIGMGSHRAAMGSRRAADMGSRRAAGMALILAILAGGVGACGRGGGEPKANAQRLAELRRDHEALHDTLESLVAGDTLLVEAAADSGQVILALRETLMERLIQEVTLRYLNRVELHLAPNVQVEEGGEIKVKTFLGRITAGDWQVNLTIHRIRGVLRAKPPRLSVTGTNRLHLVMPVVLEEGQGAGTIRFRWDARSVASVVCRDFETSQAVNGVVRSQEYEIDGDFVLSSTERTVIAQPEFPEEKFRIRPDLSPESWAEVQRLLESQDKITKCGIAMNPPDVIQKLRELSLKGFNIKLPRSIFRPVELPASVRESVTVEGRQVDLGVQPSTLRVTPNTFWYSAAVQTRIGAARDTLPPPAPPEVLRPTS